MLELTQADLAAKANTTQCKVSHYERGLVKPRPNTVAKLAAIHLLTLLRWIRERKMPDVSRDRNGWRIFTEAEAAAVIAYATSVNDRTSPAQTLLFENLPSDSLDVAASSHA